MGELLALGFCHGSIFAQDAIVAKSEGAIVAIYTYIFMAQEAEKVGTKAKQKTNYRSVEVPHMIIPIEDKNQVRAKGAGLLMFWLDCWECDRFGDRYVLMPDINFKSGRIREYRKKLTEMGLFIFEVRTNVKERRSELWILNLHGWRNREFWRSTNHLASIGDAPHPKVQSDASTGDKLAHSEIGHHASTGDADNRRASTGDTNRPALRRPLPHPETNLASTGDATKLKTQAGQEFQNASITPQYLSVTPHGVTERKEPDASALRGAPSVERTQEEEIALVTKWTLRKVFSRPTYPGRERLEEWLIARLLECTNYERIRFFESFKFHERQRPGASMSHLISKALQIIRKGLEVPSDFLPVEKTDASRRP